MKSRKQSSKREGRAAVAPARAAEDPSLADLISYAPPLNEPEPARARVAEWLKGLPQRDAEPFSALFTARPLVRALLESVGENSPYLWDLASREPRRLLTLLNAQPTAHFVQLLSDTDEKVSKSTDDAEVMRLLRRAKSEAALLVGLTDIGRVWPVMQTAKVLTEVADMAVSAAVRFLLSDAARMGRFHPIDESRPDIGSGYIVLAMGKMGAFELNFSSDIDLIVLYDSAAARLPENVEPSGFFVRLTQRVVRILQERTADGYVFRADLRLRPDPASTAIAVSTAAAASYYESVGQNWERAAMIKVRACAGDVAAGQEFLEEIAPFVWRKYLDFAAVADVHAMKRQINAYRGHAEIAVEGHNIKLGRGGIREIEFFVQTQQLIAGGRNPGLRDRDTLTTLDKLCDDKWIDAEARDAMKEAYCFLRVVEHRLQMMNDEQTQSLPVETAKLERFARFLGFETRDAFAADLLRHLQNVQHHYGRLFEKSAEAERPALVFPPHSDDHKTLDQLSQLGFAAPLEASSIIRTWLAGEYRSLKGETARNHLQALLSPLLEQLANTGNPSAALVLFDHFLANLHGGARLLSMLRQNPELISLISLVLGTAPRLGETLARYPEVMDTLVDPSFSGALPEESELRHRFDAALREARHEEDLLERIRMFGLEYMFLIGVRTLSGAVSARQAGEAYARLADAVIRTVHSAVGRNFATTYGHLDGGESAVVAMGKLGGEEMTATSDLDLILIYDFNTDSPQSDSERSLHGTQYYARLTQRLINALTAQTNYGALYQVDMRLRPSGRAGPLATRLQSFADYQENEAWTWEHMALTRARIVSGSPQFKERVEAIIREVLRRPRDPELTAGDVVEMRAAIAKEKGDGERWDLKYAAGGLIDIEFIAQYLQLIHAHERPEILDTSTAGVLDKAWTLGILPVKDAEILRPAVRLYHDLTQILRLCLPAAFDAKAAGAGLLRLLARAGDVPDFPTLEATLIDTQLKVRESFVRLLGRAPD
ncbi:MAG TPA: bifunctional [glutamine synthetase] adenylyltransferase/[glutamine synthetase]-adenylyl-L-tyrosine phosphorylase [Pseudolabrys sp.]|nr:bifunctional [glutamine synthetase] adenylyltransferase/[glutamine synthetase]-adenylyl-L-tyrosine phosphorylase [Pseudolabrys sp.]